MTDVATAWQADIGLLRDAPSGFLGPLGACETPLWSDDVDVFFSPSIDRSARRTLTLWLRSNWPGEVDAAPAVPEPPSVRAGAAPHRSRLVFALGHDDAWVHDLASAVRPADRPRWQELAAVGARREPHDAAGGGLVYTHRLGTGPRAWTRVSIGASVPDLLRLQQRRRAFCDWTAVDAAGTRAGAGRVVVGDDGVAAFDFAR